MKPIDAIDGCPTDADRAVAYIQSLSVTDLDRAWVSCVLDMVARGEPVRDISAVLRAVRFTYRRALEFYDYTRPTVEREAILATLLTKLPRPGMIARPVDLFPAESRAHHNRFWREVGRVAQSDARFAVVRVTVSGRSGPRRHIKRVA